MSKHIMLQLEKYMDHHDQLGYFNGSVLVAYQNEILLCKGYGMANFEHDVPNTPGTKFRIGSITKGFTALAILQLHEQGLLDIDTPIHQILEDYPNGDRITIHHLLNHTSGIPNFTSFSDYWTKTMRLPSSIEEIIHSFKNLPLEFTPGEKFRYCSSSYILLTAIIEKVSGLTYSEYLEKNILKPLHMKNSGYDNGKTVLKHQASGYSVWEDIIHTEHVDMSIPQGGYGMYSTVEDLYLWDQSLYTNQLLNQESLNRMFDPYENHYGYGWAVSNIKINGSFHRCISHYGDINGFCADFLRFVDDQLTVIVLSNLNLTPVMKISRDLAKIVLGESVEVPVIREPIHMGSAEMNQYTGIYQSDQLDVPIEISKQHDQLYITMPKRYGAKFKYGLIPVSINGDETVFYTKMIHEKAIFKRINEHDVLLNYRDVYGQEIMAQRMPKGYF